jgi:hypothetical protein
MKLVFLTFLLFFTLFSNGQTEWEIELYTKMPDSRMGVWVKGDYTIKVNLDSISTYLRRSQQNTTKAIEYYGEQDSNFVNYYKATANRYNVAATQTEEAKDGFDLQTLILYEGRENLNQNNGNSRILVSFIKQQVEQGKALVFYKGEPIFKLCCTSKLRDEGITFSEILNRGYETITFFDQPENYLFYEYYIMGW